MLRIRLTRTGRKNLSNFRIVVAQKKAPIKGRFIEILGNFDPKSPRKTGLKINEERLKYWLSNGAKPTDTVNNLLVDAGIFDANRKIKKSSKKKVKEKEAKPEKPEVIESPTVPQTSEGSAMEITAEETEKETVEKETAPQEIKEKSPEQTQMNQKTQSKEPAVKISKAEKKT
jgi:small subunit ribosomal protein S16